jgi:hypothetical protein
MLWSSERERRMDERADRRAFLQLAAGALGAAGLPPTEVQKQASSTVVRQPTTTTATRSMRRSKNGS